MPESAGSPKPSGRLRRVLDSAWRHAELSRYDGSLTWGVVEEHWAGPIDDESVYRDFGQEPWRRWSSMLEAGTDAYEPRMTMLVTRLVRESAVEAGWAVVHDERDRIELERSGVRIAAWSEPGAWLRVGDPEESAEPWFETNDLAAVERVLDRVVSDAPGAGGAARESGARRGRLEWGSESWLEFSASCPFPIEMLERIAQHPL